MHYIHAHSLLLYIDFNDVSDVVRHYQQKQANDRARSFLVVSNGLYTNAPLRDGREWTLGNYTLEIGGVSTRSKKKFGIYSPPKVPDDVSYTAYNYLHIFYNFITQFGDNEAKEKESSVTLCSKSPSESTSSYLPAMSKCI